MEIIRFICICGKQIKVAAHFAGHDGRCPACDRLFVVPDPPMSSVAQSSKVVHEEIPTSKSHSELSDLAAAVTQLQGVRQVRATMALPQIRQEAAIESPTYPSERPPPLPQHIDASAQIPPRALLPPTPSLSMAAKGAFSHRAIAITCCVVGLVLMAVIITMVRRTSANAKVTQLVASAQEAHSQGKLEEAITFLKKASLVYDADNCEDARDLETQYGVELGKLQEPVVASYILSAETFLSAADRPSAKVQLNEALKRSHAPSSAKARRMLEELELDEMQSSYRASAAEMHLLQIARNRIDGKFFSDDERKMAVEQIVNQEMLFDIACNKINGSFFSDDSRRSALSKITDRSKLTKVAMNDVEGTFFADFERDQAKAQLGIVTEGSQAEVSQGLTNANSGGRGNAYDMARKFVLDRLKAPSTASFPAVYEVNKYTATANGNVWTVKSFVDAENSFGAKLRKRWTAVLRYNSDDTWSVMSIDMPNE